MRETSSPTRQFDPNSIGLPLGIASLAAALIAFNSPIGPLYSAFWEGGLSFGFDGNQSLRTLSGWIDVGLMPLLFTYLGIRVKRDIVNADSFRAWSLPPRMGAAIGSAMIPVALYAGAVFAALLASNPHFALGRLEVAVGAIAILIVLNRIGVQQVFPYVAFGIVLWLALMRSGIHPVIAGAIVAMTMPAVREIPEDDFFERSGLALEAFEQATGPRIASWQLRQQDALRQLERAATHAQSPVTRIESVLRPVCVLFIIPVFLLANGGIAMSEVGAGLDWRVFAGVAIGILVVRAGLALDASARRGTPRDPWRNVVSEASWLGGVSLAASLFAAKLMFDPSSLDSAKLGVLAGSGFVWLIAWWRATDQPGSESRRFMSSTPSHLSARQLQEEP